MEGSFTGEKFSFASCGALAKGSTFSLSTFLYFPERISRAFTPAGVLRSSISYAFLGIIKGLNYKISFFLLTFDQIEKGRFRCQHRSFVNISAYAKFKMKISSRCQEIYLSQNQTFAPSIFVRFWALILRKNLNYRDKHMMLKQR